jgi:NDP-sugar pyrophosphorylase family protein
MGRPADAFNLMRRFGLGISNANLTNFQKNGVPAKFAGRIFLQVEANGEAYYVNPTNMKLYYLGRPDDALRIMRELSLGISNTNIRQIAVGK